MENNVVVFIDSGDTIIDESTQVYDGIYVTKADFIEGADKMLDEMKRRGYKIVMVADGYHKSFENVYAENGYSKLFDAKIYSEDLGTAKPDAKMFQAAMDAIGLCEGDKKRIVMIGNNVMRDIRGANEFGISSILLEFSPRYRMTPNCAEEEPTYRAAMPKDVLTALDRFERTIKE